VSSHDVDDLCQAGTLGLMDAARRFDPSRGIKFRTFAQMRIIGAAIDYLRTLYGRARQKIRPVLATDLPHEEDESPMDLVAGDAATVDRQLAAVRRAVLDELRRQFPIRTAQMALCHVFDRRTLEDVGKDWEITESRLSQLMRPIRERVRDIIEREVAKVAAEVRSQ